MSAVGAYKESRNPAWLKSEDLKTLADAAVAELESVISTQQRWAEEASRITVKLEADLSQEKLAHKILDVQREKHRKARRAAEDELATVNSLLDMKREREQHWSDEAWRYKKEAEVALENMTQQRDAAIAKPARDRISTLEAENKRLTRLIRDRDALVKRAIERSAVTAVSPSECFDLLAKAEGLFEARDELVKSNNFIELLKGMVEQLEDGEHVLYDLEDLEQRIEGNRDLTHTAELKSVEVRGTVTEGHKFVKAAMIEGVKFVISSIEDRSIAYVTLVSCGKEKK